MSNTTSTKDLKRVLGFWDLMSTATGQIIGAGIMSLTGVAIAMTGKSVPISFLLASLFVVTSSVPLAIIMSTARFRGGQYSVVASLFGKKYGGFYMIVFILSNLSIAMYALSFADYALTFIPGVGLGARRLIAIGLLTTFYILNFFGIDKMAKIQNLIVGTLVVALALFAIFGITKVNPNYIDDNFMTGGIVGMFQAAALLTFATGGATAAADLAGEAKNPTKDIPKVIIISTIGVAILYGFMSVIAAGVLPIEQVANQPLTWVAQTILPKALYVFFVVGGAMFALVSTLNAQLAWATKPLLQACVDGWFPRKLAYLHPKYKTPVILLTLFYIVGLLPILFGFDIGVVGSIVVIVGSFTKAMVSISLLSMPKVMPELWNKSPLKVSAGTAKLIVILAIAVAIMQVTLLAVDLSMPLFIANAAVLVFGMIFSVTRYKSGKVDMEVSYEEL